MVLWAPSPQAGSHTVPAKDSTASRARVPRGGVGWKLSGCAFRWSRPTPSASSGELREVSFMLGFVGLASSALRMRKAVRAWECRRPSSS